MALTYKCMIADDEVPAHLVIKSHINHIADLEFAGSAFNGKETLHLLKENNFDIIFLDINMPVFSGIEILQQLPVRPATIITTAYSDYALDAYRHDAVDYLLKPVSLPDFAKAVAKAKIFCDAKQNVQTNKTLTLKTGKEEIIVSLTDVTCIESYGNYLKVYMTGRQMPVVIYGALSAIASELDSTFIRVHKSYIINTGQLQHIDGATVQLANGMTVPVGRKYQILLSELPGF
jgi:two-component system, LytTR family, response regulator